MAPQDLEVAAGNSDERCVLIAEEICLRVVPVSKVSGTEYTDSRSFSIGWLS